MIVPYILGQNCLFFLSTLHLFSNYSLFPQNSDDYVPENLSEVTFAPQDVSPVSMSTKDNVHGLGYSGIDPRKALPGSHINLFGPSKKRSGKGIQGQVCILLSSDDV